MRILSFLFLALMVVSAGCGGSSDSGESTTKERHEPKTDEEKLSYSIGIIASNSVMTKLEESKVIHLIIPENMVQGMNDFVAGKDIQIDPKKAKENLNRFFRMLQEKGQIDEMELKDREILSYSIGVDAIREVYTQITQSGADSVIDVRFVLEAMNHYILREKLSINVIDAKKIVENFFKGVQKEKNSAILEQYEPNRIAGEEFLAENAKRKGIKVTQSGLQLEVLKEGKGVNPKLGDTVEVHYTGTFIDGKKFDSSKDRNETYKFVIDFNYPIISGWVEGAQLMKEGGKYKIYLPSDLGYKDRLDSPIPPYSVLVFEIELISVNKEGI